MSSLLAGIRFGAESDSDESSKKDKKKKKESKKKDAKSPSSHKKKHKVKEADNDAPPASSTPVELTIPAAQATLPRDEWMNMDFAGGPPRAKQLTPEEARAAAQETKKQDEIDRGLREPNSGLLYGLYDPKNVAAPIEAAMAAPVALPTMGDGGASWKRKMLQRAKQKAAETGDSLESIVRGQYGMTLAELEAQAAQGSRADDDSHLRYKRSTPHRSQQKGSADTSRSSGADKNIIAGYASRMKHTNLSKETSRGDAALGKSNDGGDDDDDGGPIDYSKLPDDDERGDRRADKRPRHWTDSSRDKRRSAERSHPRRRSRSRSSDRRGSHQRRDDRSRPPPSDSRKEKVFVKPAVVELTPAQQEEAARRAAFLYRQPASASAPTESAAVPNPAPTPTPPASTPLPPSAPSDDPVDLNKLAAQALRAKMRGNMALFQSLTKQINEAEHAMVAATAPPPSKKRQAPIKPARAMVRPRETAELPHRAEDDLVGSKQGKRKQPGADLTLDEMVRQEKAGEGDSNMDAVYARNIVRLGARYEGTELSAGKKGAASGFDEDETGDLAINLHQSSSSRLTEKAFVAASDRAALSDRMQWDKAMQKCRHCPKSDGFKSHLVVSMAPNAYLALPASSTIVDLQCVIVPVEHVVSLSAADEAVDADVRQFKAALVAMAAAQNMSMLFLERTFDAGRKKHTVVECVPVPTDVGLDAPMFFKQAMLECDEEWSTHKKVLDSTGKGIKRTVPPNFAYFHVEWAAANDPTTGGYAHIIEDAAQFPADFGLDTIAGMLDVDPPRFGRYLPNLAAENQRVKAFQAVWQPFDWTQATD